MEENNVLLGKLLDLTEKNNTMLKEILEIVKKNYTLSDSSFANIDYLREMVEE